MSSYLNIYLIPKKDPDHPLLLLSISRASDVYTAFHDNLQPAFIGNEKTPNFTRITAGDIHQVVEDTRKDIDSIIKRNTATITAFNTIQNPSKEAFSEHMEDLVSTSEYIEEQQSLLHTLEDIEALASDLEYSDFEPALLINID